MFTISCGLLIALALQALVEWGHHRELVHEARANIRRELTANEAAADKNLRNIDKNLAITQADLKTEQQLRDHPEHFHGSLNFTFAWDTAGDAAWRTARDTGALSYMPYAEVQRYADVYEEQARINTAQDGIYEDDARAYAPIAASSPNIDDMRPAQLAGMIDATALADTHLLFLKQTTAQLRNLYSKTLNTK